MHIRPVACLCVVSLSVFASGSAAADGPPLTLQAALDEALSHNPGLLALKAQIEADRLRPAQERILMPPMLEAQIWQWPLDRVNPAGAIYMLTMQQDLPGRGKREARERAGQAEVALAEASVPVRARDILADVKRTYADLFVSRKAVAISWETIGLLRQIADAAQVRYAAGKGAQQDVVKAVVELSRLHEEQIMRAEKARMAEARLNTLLGRDPASPIGDLSEPQFQPVVPPVAELQRLAVERQPELAMARGEIARAEAAVAATHAERRPDFVVSGGYMLMPGDAGAFTGRVGITWPNAPWSRKRIDLAEEQSKRDVQAAQARYNAAVNALRLMVQEAAIRFESAFARAELLRTSLVPQANHALDVSRVGYQTDRAELLDIIDNQRMLADARLGYYRALADAEQARADLERAVGTPLPGTIAASRSEQE